METMTKINNATKKAKNMVNSYDWCFNKSKCYDVGTFYTGKMDLQIIRGKTS